MRKTSHRQSLEEQLAARKHASVAQLLFQAARVYNERALAKMRERVSNARPALTQLLPYIALDGTRLTEVARRAGITKQAVGPLVTELEEMGLVRRTPDPTDGRAQLISFTERGLEQLVAGFDVLDAIEATLEAVVGAPTLARLRRDLERVLPVLEALGGEGEAGSVARSDVRRPPRRP